MRRSEPETAAGTEPAGRSEERALVARAADGDRGAQQALLGAHLDHIRRRVLRLMGNRSDVDDLVQTACVEVLRSLPRYRGDASFALWVDRITANVVYKHFRSDKRRRRRLQAVADAVPETGAPADQARALASRRAAEQARALIDELKPERRIVFLLVAVEGQTIAEAAAALDLKLPAAKSRFLRARREIDAKIAKHPELAEMLGTAATEGRP